MFEWVTSSHLWFFLSLFKESGLSGGAAKSISLLRGRIPFLIEAQTLAVKLEDLHGQSPLLARSLHACAELA